MDVQELINQYNSGTFTGNIIAVLREQQSALFNEKNNKISAFHAACSAYFEDVRISEKRIDNRIAQLEDQKEQAEKTIADAQIWAARAVAEGQDSAGALFRESITETEQEISSIDREIESLRTCGVPGNPRLYTDVMSKLDAAINTVKQFNQENGAIIKFATEQRRKWDTLIPDNAGVFSASYDEVHILESDRQLLNVKAHYQKGSV